MKKIFNLIIYLPISLILLGLGILMLPLIIILLPFKWYSKKKFTEAYNAYLITLEGKNFFCYDNRKKGFDFIETEIIPNLPIEVEPLFLIRRKMKNEKYNLEFLSKALYSYKNFSNFPHLLKIRNGKAINTSVNNEFFNTLENKEKRIVLNRKIKKFFELDPKSAI